MTKYDRESEAVIDLGAATVETKGQGHIVQADLATEQYKPGSMLSAD
jgi:hypothetical protein